MGKAKQPAPVKLMCSIFTPDETLLAVVRGALTSHWGPLDYQSELLPFEHTSYYAREFGERLLRQIVAFANLIPREQLASIKCATNALEMTWIAEGRRRANLDPGYIAMDKLVLATTKDYSHRIYIGQGIYAEVTLRYRRGSFQAWEWTYPDYASPRYLQMCNEIRAIYAAQLRQRGATW